MKRVKQSYKFSSKEIERVKRLCESEDVQKKEQVSKEKSLELLKDGTSFIDFNKVPSDKRKAAVEAFKKAGLVLQNTGLKLVAKMKPTTDALSQAYAKNSEKVNMLIGLGMAAGILSQYGVTLETCCASAAIAMCPEMLKILAELYTMIDLDED